MFKIPSLTFGFGRKSAKASAPRDINLDSDGSPKGIEPRQLSWLRISCFIASTLMVAALFKLILAKTIVPLHSLNVTLVVTAIYTLVVYGYRHLQKSGACYLFQLTVAFTFGFCEYEAPQTDYRAITLGVFLVLMFQNMCIDKVQYRVGKIDKIILRNRTAVCCLLPVLGLVAYNYSFQHFPEAYNLAAGRGDPSKVATYLLEDGHPEKAALLRLQQGPCAQDEVPTSISLLNEAPDFFQKVFTSIGNAVKSDPNAESVKVTRSGEVEPLKKLDGTQVYGYPREWVDQLKSFENDPLFKGEEVQSNAHKDKLRPDVTEVGYGVTAGEIFDAKTYGFLPKDATLPKSMTKEEADGWMEKVTLPTYDAMVSAKVKVPLTVQQRFALLSFCHNTGGGNLEKLAKPKDRLNSGNLDSTPPLMRLYVNAGKHLNVPGLVRRRNWEACLFETPLDGIAFADADKDDFTTIPQ